MKTQQVQIIGGKLRFESKDVKGITIPRILFHKDYTKIDFGYDPGIRKYIKDKRIHINTDLYLQTENNTYKLLSAQIFEKPFFKKDTDYIFFSLLFEPIDEDISELKIINHHYNKNLYPFGFEKIYLEG